MPLPSPAKIRFWPVTSKYSSTDANLRRFIKTIKKNQPWRKSKWLKWCRYERFYRSNFQNFLQPWWKCKWLNWCQYEGFYRGNFQKICQLRWSSEWRSQCKDGTFHKDRFNTFFNHGERVNSKIYTNLSRFTKMISKSVFDYVERMNR